MTISQYEHRSIVAIDVCDCHAYLQQYLVLLFADGRVLVLCLFLHDSIVEIKQLATITNPVLANSSVVKGFRNTFNTPDQDPSVSPTPDPGGFLVVAGSDTLHLLRYDASTHVLTLLFSLESGVAETNSLDVLRAGVEPQVNSF